MEPSIFNRTLFIDSSSYEEIQRWNRTGVIDGVTTNQFIMLKDGVTAKQYERVIQKICKEMGNKPVSVELTDSTASVEAMVKEAHHLNRIAKNIVVKVPMIPDTTKSLEVIARLADDDIAVNVTTMMTFEQMIMAALATRHCKRLSFISIFWGRSIEDHEKYRSKKTFAAQYPETGPESDINKDPKQQVSAISRFLQEGHYENPKIIVGSIRNASQVGEAFAAGGHIPTVTPKTLKAMLYSRRSIETIEQFDKAWRDLQKR